jgi:hypothetical protein
MIYVFIKTMKDISIEDVQSILKWVKGVLSMEKLICF